MQSRNCTKPKDYVQFYNWTSGVVIVLLALFGINMTEKSLNISNRIKTTLMKIILLFIIIVNAYCFITWTWFAILVLHISARKFGANFILTIIGIWMEVFINTITIFMFLLNADNIKDFLQIASKNLYNSISTSQMKQITNCIRWPTIAITSICLVSNAAYGGYLFYVFCFDLRVKTKFALLNSAVYKVPLNNPWIFIAQAINVGLHSGLQRFILTSTLVFYAHMCLLMKTLLKIPEQVFLKNKRSGNLGDKVMTFLEKHEFACYALTHTDFLWSKIAFCWVGVYTVIICLEIKVICAKMELMTLLHLVAVASHFLCFIFCAASATIQVNILVTFASNL